MRPVEVILVDPIEQRRQARRPSGDDEHRVEYAPTHADRQVDGVVLDNIGRFLLTTRRRRVPWRDPLDYPQRYRSDDMRPRRAASVRAGSGSSPAHRAMERPSTTPA